CRIPAHAGICRHNAVKLGGLYHTVGKASPALLAYGKQESDPRWAVALGLGVVSVQVAVQNAHPPRGSPFLCKLLCKTRTPPAHPGTNGHPRIGPPEKESASPTPGRP